jgi:hypothetical protein
LTTPPNVSAATSDTSDITARKFDFAAFFGAWADDNADFLSALHHKMAQNGYGVKKLPENTLWDMIADTWSTDWARARTHLGDAANDLYERQKPENIPLGAIGLALDAGELDQSEKRYREALADFTVINEALRQDEKLSRLLEILCTVEESQTITATAQKLNNSFKVAEKKPAKEKPVKKGLRAYVDMVFGRRQTATAPAVETAETVIPKTATGTTPTANI